jgi:hypothetical protein
MHDNYINTLHTLTEYGVIRNMNYYRQRFAFETFPLKASDVDMEVDLSGEAFIRAEFKHGNSPVPMAQQIAAKSWCRAVGAKKSAFFVVARHEVQHTEDVPTEALEVDSVYWKTPDMQDYNFHRYNGYDNPTFNQFLTTIAVNYGLYHYLDYDKAAMDRYWPYDKVFASAWDCQQAQALREVANKKMFAGIGLPYQAQPHESSATKRKLLEENPPAFWDYIMTP